MSRTSISVDEDTRDRCKEFKRESESWDEFINRAVDALAGDSDEFTDAEERIMKIWSKTPGSPARPRRRFVTGVES